MEGDAKKRRGLSGQGFGSAPLTPAVSRDDVIPFSAYNVEGVAMNLQQVHDSGEKEPYLAKIEEASGKFQALANLVRIG